MYLLVPKFRWLAIVLTTLLVAAAPLVQSADSLNLNTYKGKVVMVDFWASWCVPCRRSFPWMNEMQSRYGDDGLVIIAVNMDADFGEAAKFLADYPADFSILYDPAGNIAKEFDVIAMPSTYVFGRDGQQVARHLGFKVREQENYEAQLLETLNQ